MTFVNERTLGQRSNIMIDWLSENKEWFFSSSGATLIGIIFPFIILGIKTLFITNRKRPVGDKDKMSFIANNVPVQTYIVPPAIAMPDFNIRQVGFTGVYGKQPRYTFRIHNNGGSCYNMKIKSNISTEVFSLSKLPRDQSHDVDYGIDGCESSFMIIISGVDANGVSIVKKFWGELNRNEYEFHHLE